MRKVRRGASTPTETRQHLPLYFCNHMPCTACTYKIQTFQQHQLSHLAAQPRRAQPRHALGAGKNNTP